MKSAKALVPAIAVLVSIVVIARAGGIHNVTSGYIVDTAPTPYSADHAVALLRGSDDTGAPTF